MLPIDPGDGPGSVTPTQPLHDIVPPQATPHGGMIIRPGAVAWGGMRESRDRSASCEAIERALSAAATSPAELPGLLTELAATRLWLPLPALRRPFTDGSAVRLPLVSYDGTDFVPCFTSVLRLTDWVDQEDAPEQRAGDARTASPAVVPHLVVPAAGLAGRLPAGVGLAINPGGTPSMPLYPECLPHLAALAVNGRADPQVVDAWTACNVKRLYSPG
jgi:type III secretion system (T3SS) SseB-like protein